MKKLVALLMAFVLCGTALVGCGTKKETSSASGSSSTESTSSAGASGWAYIQQKGTLVVGLDVTFAPMGFYDDNHKLVGFDVELANAVATQLGIKVEFKGINWDAKELELSSKRIDCIWNGMSATPDRQEKMALTKQYLHNKIIIMALDPKVKINSSADLKNYNVGVQSGSTGLDRMQADSNYNSFKDKVKQYGSYDEAYLALKSKRIDCVVIDETLGDYKNSQLTEKMTTCAFDFGDDYYAIGCRKGETDLADKLNGAIQAQIDNGTAKTISEKWFGKDIVSLKDYK